MALLEGFYSLSKDTNKVRETDTGVVSELLPELILPMPDDELISLKQDWLLCLNSCRN